ncbi:erythromycin esterase family protein [Polaromonas naphthalenivorans]|uniref:Erythromycin esterase n=1 Tax=Polaromonas naphthalenivorans (strain CJ2) TaxID=365044 RepID=A1VPB6_POLNA|nr:Erythromycin esterase [Polaromonas naphthalenivorans CJ2]
MKEVTLPFHDRHQAGVVLAEKLAPYAGRSSLLVLALPRGGVAVGFEVARALQAPLDIFVVRKLGFPGHEEYAMGAIASGGVRVMTPLHGLSVTPEEVAEAVAREQDELVRREQLYRGHRPPISIEGRTVILVDDGLATGATMRAAVLAVRQRHPAHLVVAVPVGAEDSCQAMRSEADEVVCVATPSPFRAVGLWYKHFPQASDEEVITLLEEARSEHELALKKQKTPFPPQQAHPHQPHHPRNALVDGLQQHLHALTGAAHDYDPLMELIGPARFALLGEASHGTQEFYRERAAITRRLITEKGFTAIAVEADWPDAWRVNRYVRGLGADADAASALSGFKRFPAWMWRNTEVRDFIEWLRDYNTGRSPGTQVGFYGMDLYSLFTSMQEVLAYLKRVDPEAAERARYRYSCFDHAAEDSQAYGYAASFGLAPSCEDAVVQQLREMTRHAADLPASPGMERDEAFYAQQNARLVRNAEEYYRTMFHARESSWNLRDSHMVETLQALDRHLGADGQPPKIAVWAHNSHLGDAAATEMGERGEWNVGQLMRDRYGSEAVRIGFSTHHGWVTAASNWEEPPQRKRVQSGLPGSWEKVFHDTGSSRFLLDLKSNAALRKLTAPLQLQRAIGVIYRPETERQSHYFFTHLSAQFDAMIHIDETSALEPLDKGPVWSTGEAPETFPSGM